ncbi:MAG TPA: hypothetical protein VGN87_13940 [Paenibacillus sp.]|jgi:hypothetical protein
MDMVRIELNEMRKGTIKGFIDAWSDVEDRDATDWGIKAGLGWVVRKLQINEIIYEVGNFTIEIPLVLVNECRKEWRENSVNAYWNLGYARAIFSVFSTLGLQMRHDEEAIECILDYYNK